MVINKLIYGVNMVICPECEKDVKDAKFCSNCGALLQKAEKVVVEVEDNTIDAKFKEVPEEETVEVEPVAADVPEEVAEEVVEEQVEEEPVVEDVPEEVEEETVVEEPVAEEQPPEEEINGSKKTKFCANCGTEVDVNTVFCPQCGFKLVRDEKPQTKFCQSCGEKINVNAEICPHCGVRVASVGAYEEKSVVISAILSFLFPGLGHLYLGLTKKGLSFIIAYIISAVLIILVIGFVLVFIVWIWALIDTIKSTEAINKGEFVEDKLF
jgi:TM2 domain-containing membrane protein YozV/DNA-directed RNA polymerase subunit RPC12/RpoP